MPPFERLSQYHDCSRSDPLGISVQSEAWVSCHRTQSELNRQHRSMAAARRKRDCLVLVTMVPDAKRLSEAFEAANRLHQKIV